MRGTHHGGAGTSRATGDAAPGSCRRDICRLAHPASGAMNQMLAEVLDRAAPGEFGGLAVVDGHALLVGKAVLGVIAVELDGLASGLHALLEGVDDIRRAPVVLGGEMALQW